MALDGNTRIIAHVGYPTATFKAPMIYNPYFESIGLNATVVPMGVKAEDFDVALPAIMRFSNVHGALITMPHKISVLPMLDEVSTAVKIAGSCNAVLRRADGSLLGDMFDGEGFVRGLRRKGCKFEGARVLVVGSGGVGSAIAAALAAAGVAELALFDIDAAASEALAVRVAAHYTTVRLSTGTNDPDGFNIVVNATPLGMRAGDKMPMDISRIAPSAYVGEVVMKQEMTGFLQAAEKRGCTIQIGIDMLFEQIPAYLEFFGFPTTTAERLRELALVEY
ncbi:MAG: shikimate dehydrogenase family protein [Bosea sp. (in: a-proteobacteria)]